MKKAIIAIAIVLSLILLANCGDDSYDAEDWGKYYDWGDSHYWNSQSHSVETNTAHRQQNVRMQDVQDQSPQAGIPTAVPFILAHAQNAGATSTRMRRGA